MKSNKAIGAEAERKAEEYLIQQGVSIIERNFRSKQGEIDLIGYDRGYLVFFEVKYRKTNAKGIPEEAVGIAKQKRICKTAVYYCYRKNISASASIRYDVVAIQGEEIRWHQNAFFHINKN